MSAPARKQSRRQSLARLRERGVAVAHAAYKRALSPGLHLLAHTLSPFGAGCAFQPTCSEYAALALAQHGLLRGGAMALWRLLRCNPCARGGWDPVPPSSRQPAPM